MPVAEMVEAYPAEIKLDRSLIAACIEASLQCAQACTACADACLSEDDVDMLRTCIRSDLDCADVCVTTSNVLSRHTGYDPNLTRAVLAACIQACTSSGDECERHAGHHDHCRICAEACRRCRDACEALLAAIA